MASNVVGLFDDPSEAQSAIRDLEAARLGAGHVNLLQSSSSQTSTVFDQLGIPHDDAAAYRDGIQNGGAVVVV